MKFFKNLLIYSHRYIGIPLSFMFVLWFVSAFFMIYTGGMPRITPAMQVDGMQNIDFAAVKVSPAQAVARAGYPAQTVKMRTILSRPVYEFADFNQPLFIAADNGEQLEALTEEQGARLASDFLSIPKEQFQYSKTIIEPDQWTLSSSRELPLYKYLVADGLGTEVYVSPNLAKVSVYTTRQSRMLAWLGTIPHWLYFTELRNNQPLWYTIVVTLAYAGCIMAVLGLLLGFTQYRKVVPSNAVKTAPYRGLMRWHYILGVLFGIVTLTWVFSGLASMEPWEWTNAQGVNVSANVYHSDELELADFPSPSEYEWSEFSQQGIKALEFVRVLGSPYLVASFSIPTQAGSNKRDRLHQPYNINGQSSSSTVVVNANTHKQQVSFNSANLVRRVDQEVGDAQVIESELLESYDDYYYSRQGQLPLPVLRVKFDDQDASWLYIDPQQARLLSLISRNSRLERWLYSGLHSLDFAFWYHKRPLWDLGVILLLTGGLLTSLLGLYFGMRRLRTDFNKLINKFKHA